ncbi:MAG: 1-(5-phosphoribosyl)-5-[(5-phosphoribosylamino)methylideneamino]imidazole-4-carboxamide isomerase [Rickettsiales bacterium]|nr:1-(5-phosphoribosyl)-5-[(5-phosphoribosylamino)methylideneamino]imidazole-4-carboxamide isomerase [Rickettsiales bacterium]
MILYPAIDLKDGQCVRLRRGDMEQSTVFNDNPAAQARDFAAAGSTWLHLVDLNGAFEGRPINASAVESILSAITIPVQLGGGIRDMATIDAWLERGIRRIILGTVAVKDPDLVRAACRKWPGRVAVGIDAKGGKVAIEGWAELSELTAEALAGEFEGAGVSAIIYTDVERDGVLSGVNIEATARLAKSTSIPVIASGGVASLDDLLAIQANGTIEGAISGRAIYDGRINLEEALAALGKQTS